VQCSLLPFLFSYYHSADCLCKHNKIRKCKCPLSLLHSSLNHHSSIIATALEHHNSCSHNKVHYYKFEPFVGYWFMFHCFAILKPVFLTLLYFSFISNGCRDAARLPMVVHVLWSTCWALQKVRMGESHNVDLQTLPQGFNWFYIACCPDVFYCSFVLFLFFCRNIGETFVLQAGRVSWLSGSL
jgi:hypothetical protein